MVDTEEGYTGFSPTAYLITNITSTPNQLGVHGSFCIVAIGITPVDFSVSRYLYSQTHNVTYDIYIYIYILIYIYIYILVCIYIYH